MHYVSVANINGSYMFQLQSTHQQDVYVRNIKEIMYLQFTYSYKWLVDDILALPIKIDITHKKIIHKI